MHLMHVIDKGPSEPEPVREDASDVERRDHEAVRRDFEAWHKKHKEPTVVEMDSMNAREAIERDPARYEIENERPVKARPLLEDRITLLEQRLARLENPDAPPPGVPTEPGGPTEPTGPNEPMSDQGYNTDVPPPDKPVSPTPTDEKPAWPKPEKKK